METQNLILSIVAAGIIFDFCFRLNIFTSQICCYFWGPRVAGAVNHDIPYFSLLLLVSFVLKHNVDEKIREILKSEFT